jgi:biopolymer transport protein ExbD
MARERRLRGDEPCPEPDILPLMNLTLMLILALITMASVLPLGFISTEAQKLARGGAGGPPPGTEKVPLNLIVFITESGFNLSIQGTVKMGEADPKNPGRKLPLIPKITLANGESDYNYQDLQARLIKIKEEKDPKEESVTITADPEVIFDYVIKVMDAIRFKPRIEEEAKLENLFPHVSFAAGIVG